MWPAVEWQSWMDDPEYIRGPAPVYARPAGLGSLGSDSYFTEPYKVRAPHRVHIGARVGIGENALISVVEELNGIEYDPELRIGDDCMIGTSFHLTCAGRMEIGRGVAISSRVFIGDFSPGYEDVHAPIFEQPPTEPAPIRVGDHAAIGVGAIVLPGVTLGEHSMVAAGSVVTRSVPPRCAVFGNPARIMRHYDEESESWVSGIPRRDPDS